MIRLLMMSRDPAWYGGAVNFVQQLTEHYSQSIECDYFLIGRRRNGLLRRLGFFVPLYDTLRLFFTIVGKKYDIYHLNPSLNEKSLLRDYLFAKTLSVFGSGKILFFFHGWNPGVEKRILNSEVLTHRFRSIVGLASYVTVLSNEAKSVLSEIGIDPNNIQVMTTMFNGDEFEGLESRRINTSDVIRICFLSRFIEEKGIFELLEAIHDLLSEGCNIELALAGNGSIEDKLRNWIEQNNINDKVTFAGYLRSKEKAQFLLDADIFVLPSYTEGCPVSLLEAMAAGLPIVASRVGGIPSIIEDGINGFLVSPKDSNDLKNKLFTLIQNRALMKKIGSTNKKIAWEKYESRLITGKIENIYSSMLAERGSHAG